ncbi:MAG TPA: extracellular solute-binding protein [Streptosporangiales bacterium]
MRRRRLASLLAGPLVLTLTLTACSNGDPGSGESGGVTTVTVWDRGGAQANVIKKYFAAWNTTDGKRLGIRVDYVPQATDKYEEVVRQGFQTRRAPDVFQAPQAQIGAWVAAGWVQSLTGRVSKRVLQADAPYLKANGPLVIKGKPYALPSTTYTTRLVYNRDLFRKAGLDPGKPPTTFSQYKKYADAITTAGHGSFYGTALPMQWVGFGNWIVDTPILATDPDLSGNGLFNVRTHRYESTKYAPVVRLYRSLVSGKDVDPGAAAMSYDAEVSDFTQGKIGMMVASAGAVASIDALDKGVSAAAAPLPVPDGQTVGNLPMNAGNPYALSALTKQPEKAATVLQVLAGVGVQRALVKSGSPPLDSTIWDSKAAKANALLQDFRPGRLDQQWPKTPTGLLELRGQGVQNVLTGLILQPDKNVDASLTDLQRRLQDAYQKGVASGQVDPDDY